LHRKVAVATIRGRPYYHITSALKLMELQFDSLSPEEAAVSNAKVIITTQDEAIIVNRKGAVMFDTELEKYPAIAKAKILRGIVGDLADDQLTIGIDPGSRIGISAIYLHQEIASAVESSPQDAVDQVSAMLNARWNRVAQKSGQDRRWQHFDGKANSPHAEGEVPRPRKRRDSGRARHFAKR
jgi:predicted RNase H-like nuclease (RuvC/YqgF family)